MEPSFYFKIIIILGCMIISSYQTFTDLSPGGRTIHENDKVSIESASSNARITITKSRTASEMCENYSKLFRHIPRNDSLAKINDEKIYGGVPVQPKEFPHMVYLGCKKPSAVTFHFSCSATLISDEWVLSAAHCAEYINVTYVAVMGQVKLERPIPPSFEAGRVEIDHIIIHPEYVNDQGPSDIALFHLKTKVNFTEYIKPICLNENPELIVDKATISGWGLIKDKTDTDSLKKAETKVLTNEQCEKIYSGQENFKVKKICAGGDGKSICNGDSGGSLQIQHAKYRNMFMQLGIPVFMKEQGCNENKKAGGFTRISFFIQWIEQIVWPSF